MPHRDSLTATGSSYHPAVGLVMVFNLIVGTGALALPHAFQEAGWVISSILLVIISVFAFITATFVVEAMAIGNAVIYLQKRCEEAAFEDGGNAIKAPAEIIDERRPSASSERQLVIHDVTTVADESNTSSQWTPFEIRYRVELGRLSTIFFPKFGQALFYAAMAIYLYGDLAIYATAVPKSLLQVTCTYLGENVTRGNCSSANETVMTMSDPCWSGVPLQRFDVYRLYVLAFALLLGPFSFFNVQKTTLIQIATTVLRWVSLITMIVLACVMLASPSGGHGRPEVANFGAVPQLFGAAVYSFMCHHSLPSLITPIRKKKRVNLLLLGDFSVALTFYLLLAITAVFAFHTLESLYTLNFRPGFCDDGPNPSPSMTIVPLQYFLALFPVFTISASFPIIVITLRNNIHALILSLMSFIRRRRNRGDSASVAVDGDYGTLQSSTSVDSSAIAPLPPPPLRPPDRHKLPFYVERIILPLVALLPPIALGLLTDNVSFLVSITGSYAGAFVQYLIPAALIFFGRRRLAALVRATPSSAAIASKNPHRSPFGHMFWVVLVCAWAIISIALVTIDHILSGK